MRVLVTGGAGFKGCVLSDALINEGHDVTVFDSFRYGEGPGIGLLKRGARVVRGDVTQIDQITPEVEKHDAVVHLAAMVGFPLCDSQPLLAEQVNVQGTRNVVSSMHPDQLLVYASTGSVYGRVDGVCTEERAPRPLTRYGRTKLEGEHIATDFGGVALRFGTVFGVSPCMRFDLMINAFVYRAIHIGWMVIYQPDDRRSFLEVGDAAEGYLHALDHYDEMEGRAFNVGDPSMNLSKREVADAVSQQFPMRVIFEDVAADPDQRNYEVSFERVRQFGFKAQVPLDDSIAEIGAAARLNDGEARWRFRP
jgi:nucleoside-diphosphate-sugar epimerase